MNYINVNWKKVSMGFAQGRRYAEDRDPKHRGDSEANRITRQKKRAIVLTMVSSGTRSGTWAYLKKHILPIKI